MQVKRLFLLYEFQSHHFNARIRLHCSFCRMKSKKKRILHEIFQLVSLTFFYSFLICVRIVHDFLMLSDSLLQFYQLFMIIILFFLYFIPIYYIFIHLSNFIIFCSVYEAAVATDVGVDNDFFSLNCLM